MRGWEASGDVGVVKVVVPSIEEAVERFFAVVAARGLSAATTGKQNVLLRKQFLPWCHGRGFRSLKQLGVDEITQFRTTWGDSPISKYKKQERLKGFFHFCVAHEWIRTNPVTAMKPVKVPPSQTLPAAVAEIAGRSPVRVPTFVQPSATAAAELIRALEQSVTKASTILRTMDDAALAKTWRLVDGDRDVMTLPVGALLRWIMLNHW